MDYSIFQNESLLLLRQMHCDNIGSMPQDDSLNLNILCGLSSADCGIITEGMKQVLIIEICLT